MKRIFYILFRVLSTIRYWFARRFTAAGRFALACLVASAAVGLDTNLTMAYQVFTLLLSLLAISFASRLFIRTRVDARRILPQFGTVGQPLVYRLIVSSRERGTLRGLALAENLVDPRPTYREFSTVSMRGEKHHVLTSGPFGYSQWRRLVEERSIAVIREQTVDAVSQNNDSEVRIEFVPARRGTMRFEGVTISKCDPFGLVKVGKALSLRQSILILPKRYPLPPIRLPGKRVYQQGGVSLAGSIGDSEEFVSLRDYRPGDPLRKIHWKSWARSGRPVVKEYQEEFFVRHALVLDTFQAGADPAVFEEAVSVAASFACTVDTQESLLDLLFVGAQVYCVTVGRGIGRMEQALETLASVLPCEDRPFEDLRAAVMERAATVSGCICILLSWDDERKRLINGLRGLGIPVLPIVITGSPLPESPGSSQDGVRMLEVGRIAEGLASL